MSKLIVSFILIMTAFVSVTFTQSQTQPVDALPGLYSGAFVKRGQASTNYFLVLSQSKTAVMIIERAASTSIVQQGDWKAEQGKVEVSWKEQDGKPVTSQMTFHTRRNELTYAGPNAGQFAPNGLHLVRASLEKESTRLAGPVWHWEETRYNNGKSVKPNGEPRKYTIQFQPDGKFNAHMDCNSGGGQYLIQDNRIAIGSISTTLVACPPGSLVQDFVGPMEYIGTYSLEAQNSRLKLKFDSATVSFVKQN